MMNDVFCKIINGEIPSNVAYEDDVVISIMDATPFMPGHLLVIPKKHYTTVLDLDEETMAHIHKVAKNLILKMEKNYPDVESVKMVVNYGEEQKVKHYHMHLIPLYKDGSTPELSQSEMCDLLKK